MNARLVSGGKLRKVLLRQREIDIDPVERDRKSTRLNSSHSQISYAVFCLKKKNMYTKTSCSTYMSARPTSLPFRRTARVYLIQAYACRFTVVNTRTCLTHYSSFMTAVSL